MCVCTCTPRRGTRTRHLLDTLEIWRHGFLRKEGTKKRMGNAINQDAFAKAAIFCHRYWPTTGSQGGRGTGPRDRNLRVLRKRWPYALRPCAPTARYLPSPLAALSQLTLALTAQRNTHKVQLHIAAVIFPYHSLPPDFANTQCAMCQYVQCVKVSTCVKVLT